MTAGRRPRPPPTLVLIGLGLLGLVLVAALAFQRQRTVPPPFQARDWVVVGDVLPAEGDPRLRDTLDVALRLSLAQSRFVNVVPNLKVEDALARMARPVGARVDLDTGSEVAVREGARLLLLPAVAEQAGQIRVSVQVVDPRSRAVLFTETAQGRGAGSLLDSIDRINARLRTRLGEASAAIGDSAMPLAQATTPDLAALRSYSQGLAAKRASRTADAMVHFQQALAADPDFALAQIGLAACHAKNGQFALARRHALAAAANRDRLSQREALQLDAFLARFGPIPGQLSSHRLWATLFPDAFEAYYGYALAAHANNADVDALAFLAPALSQRNPALGNAYFLQGAILLSLNRYPEARQAFAQAEALGVAGEKLEMAETFAAERDFAGAMRALGRQSRSGLAGVDLRLQLAYPVFLLDQGRWDEGLRAAAELERQAERDLPSQAAALVASRTILASYGGRPAPGGWRSLVADGAQRLAAGDELDRGSAVFSLLAGGWLAARHGDIATAQRALALGRQPARVLAESAPLSLLAMLEAELALAAGDPASAIAGLRAAHDGSELYFSHAILMRALAAAGDAGAALAQADWLAGQRGRAYGEYNGQDMFSAANIVESNLAQLAAAEFALELGQPALAAQWLAEFELAWPRAGGLAFLRPRLARLRAALDRRSGVAA